MFQPDRMKTVGGAIRKQGQVWKIIKKRNNSQLGVPRNDMRCTTSWSNTKFQRDPMKTVRGYRKRSADALDMTPLGWLGR